MTLVTRELGISYGGTVIGGASTSYLLHGPYRISESYNAMLIEAEVVVVAATEGDFSTAYRALEEAFRKPRQTLIITLGSSSKTYQVSDGTGFNIRAAASRPNGGSEFDSARSRLYQVSIELDLPADLSGDNSLREKSIEVKQMATGQRVVQVGGVYTVNGSTRARAQYAAQIGALLAGIKSDLSISEWDILEQEVATDFEDTLATLRVTTKEIIFDEASGVTNVAAIKDHRIALTRTEIGPGDSDRAVSRPIEMAIVYECKVDLSVTTDLRVLYDGTIFPYLIDLVQTLTGSSLIAVKRNSPTFENAENKVAATVEMTVFTGSPLLASFTTTADVEDAPIQLVPVWDGNPHAKYVLPAASNLTRTIRTETLSFGGLVKGAAAKATAGDHGPSIFDLDSGPLALDPAPLAFGIFAGGVLNIVVDPPAKAGGKGKAIKAADAPKPGAAGFGEGRFVTVRRAIESSPVIEGVAPYQVSLAREIYTVDAVYVVDPSVVKGGGGGGGGTVGGGVEGGGGGNAGGPAGPGGGFHDAVASPGGF